MKTIKIVIVLLLAVHSGFSQNYKTRHGVYISKGENVYKTEKGKNCDKVTLKKNSIIQSTYTKSKGKKPTR